MKRKFLVIITTPLLLAACNTLITPPAPALVSPTQVRTARVDATAARTLAPTATNAPATSTSTPTPALIAPTATRTATLASNAIPLPKGAPLASWHDFPIMPGALAGQDRDKAGYYYTVPASLQQIQDFYTHEMKKMDWDLLSAATRPNDPGFLSLIYRQPGRPTFTVLVNVQGNVAVVFLAN